MVVAQTVPGMATQPEDVKMQHQEPGHERDDEMAARGTERLILLTEERVLNVDMDASPEQMDVPWTELEVSRTGWSEVETVQVSKNIERVTRKSSQRRSFKEREATRGNWRCLTQIGRHVLSQEARRGKRDTSEQPEERVRKGERKFLSLNCESDSDRAIQYITRPAAAWRPEKARIGTSV